MEEPPTREVHARSRRNCPRCAGPRHKWAVSWSRRGSPRAPDPSRPVSDGFNVEFSQLNGPLDHSAGISGFRKTALKGWSVKTITLCPEVRLRAFLSKPAAKATFSRQGISARARESLADIIHGLLFAMPLSYQHRSPRRRTRRGTSTTPRPGRGRPTGAGSRGSSEPFERFLAVITPLRKSSDFVPLSALKNGSTFRPILLGNGESGHSPLSHCISSPFAETAYSGSLGSSPGLPHPSVRHDVA
ncbi:hypothetical protein Nepgr_010858 [Nepenthes gracilis]|uniref:Uncharacterized protein n=1 Tax=Nepenthes gracilis TaxID=150966 RepID=A0AAD3SD57_NEPGR|nr:hypothetical protein Nepgr_010858 [Nepenthes gracilis]